MLVEQIVYKLKKLCSNFAKHIKIQNTWHQGAATYYQNLLNLKILKDKNNYFYFQRCIRPEDVNLVKKADRKSFHHQFQIVIKQTKNPLLPLDLICKYLNLNKSLVEIHIDNWSNRIIGCYGKGWEVRYKGVEIMQITCIDKILGKRIENSVIEYALGLERISMTTEKNYSDYYSLYKNKHYSKILKSYNKKLFLYIENIKYEDIFFLIKRIKKFLVKSFFNINYFYLASHYFNIIYATKKMHYSLRVKLIQSIYRIGNTFLNVKN